MQEMQKLYPHFRAHRRGCCRSPGLKASRQMGQSSSCSIIGLVCELNEGRDQVVEGCERCDVYSYIHTYDRGQASCHDNFGDRQACIYCMYVNVHWRMILESPVNDGFSSG